MELLLGRRDSEYFATTFRLSLGMIILFL